MQVEMMKVLEDKIAPLDDEIARRAKADPTAKRLMTIPGIGPITAVAIASGPMSTFGSNGIVIKGGSARCG